MPTACSINSRWRCGCSSGAVDTGLGDSSANGSSQSGSGAREAVCRDADGATTGSGSATGADADADADAGRSVGGRSCGAGPSSEDGAAGPATGTGADAQEGAGNSAAFPFNSGRGSSVPACPAPRSCATTWLVTGTTGVFTAAASPEHWLGRRCKPRRRSGPALPLLTRFARRCRQPKLPGSASAVVVLIVAATLTDVPASGTALALDPLGTGKGGFQLPRRGHTQLAALQAGPHPPMTPA